MYKVRKKKLIFNRKVKLELKSNVQRISLILRFSRFSLKFFFGLKTLFSHKILNSNSISL